MIYSVKLLSGFPWRFVIHTESQRAAQITARLLAERFPGMRFGVDGGPDFQYGDCHPSMRDSALSFEVQQLVVAEMVLEAAVNPERLPKWRAFQYRNGGVTALPDHDLQAVEACRCDCETVQERAIYARDPSPTEVLSCFRTDVSA